MPARTVDDFDFDADAFLAALDEQEFVGTTGEVAVGTVVGLERRPPAFSGDQDLLRQLHQAEHDLLQQLAERLGQWASILAKGGLRLPAPPQAPMVWPQSWMGVESLFSDPRSNQASPEQLERIASRLMLCRQAQRAIEEAEQSWAGLLNG